MIVGKYKTQLKVEYRRFVKNRKIIVWGTGSLFQKLKALLDIDVEKDVHFFVESDPKNDTFEGKKLISAEELSLQIKNGEKAIVLICTSAWTEVKGTLTDDLFDNIQFHEPYEQMGWFINRENLPIVILEQNIRKLLIEYDNDIPTISDESIAIMVGERSGKTHPYHAITLGVLLRLKGLNVRFLFNDLSNFGDITRGLGFNEFQNSILEDLLKEVREKYGIPYDKMSDQTEEELTEEEMKKVRQFIYYNKIWHSRKVIFDLKDVKLNEREVRWISNAKLIKGFLSKYSFDKVYTWTGLHSEWAALRILAESKKIKSYSTEYIRAGYSFSINGPTIFQRDINLLKDYSFSEGQKSKLLEIAESHINEYFPKESEGKLEQPYAVIPLNIFWDSASYTDNDIFIYFDEWLTETIQFLIEDCGVHVYVRQHPYERKFESGEDVKELLEEHFGQHRLFHFIDAYSDEDTYELIQNAQVVLPNTSTIGIESVLMKKWVVVKNSVYYADSGLVLSAKSKDEYFQLIKESLTTEKILTNKEIEKAKVYLALTILNGTDTSFGNWYSDVREWSGKSLDYLLDNEAAKWLLNSIILDRPLLNNQLGIEVEK